MEPPILKVIPIGMKMLRHSVCWVMIILRPVLSVSGLAVLDFGLVRSVYGPVGLGSGQVDLVSGPVALGYGLVVLASGPEVSGYGRVVMATGQKGQQPGMVMSPGRGQIIPLLHLLKNIPVANPQPEQLHQHPLQNGWTNLSIQFLNTNKINRSLSGLFFKDYFLT
jgi:hypothetical protein